jgi:hypothetical protein
MISPKERLGIHIVWTAFASPVLFFAGGYVNDRSIPIISRLSQITFVPGYKICKWLGGMQGSIPDLGLFVLAQIVCNWVMLLICMATIEFFINRKSRHA